MKYLKLFTRILLLLLFTLIGFTLQFNQYLSRGIYRLFVRWELYWFKKFQDGNLILRYLYRIPESLCTLGWMIFLYFNKLCTWIFATLKKGYDQINIKLG